MDWPERARRARVTALAAAERLDVEAEAGTPIEVARLDIEDERYILVPLLADGRTTGLVETDQEGRQARRVAALRSVGAVVPLTADEARARAARVDARTPRRTFLGWRPCRQSWDGFNPFWVLEFGDDDRLYVDQAGRVHPTLDPGGPGG